MSEAPNRIFLVSFRSATGRKRVVRNIPVKVPYGDVNAMGERLARATQQGELIWYRVERPLTITNDMRAALRRWPQALNESGKEVGVTWLN